MAFKSRSTRFLFLLAVIGGASFLILFLLVGPPKLLAKSEHPSFCAGCHVMEAEYNAWSHAGAHRRKACVDCHLPNDNAAIHYFWKSLDGLKDMALFYSGMVPERIVITDHGKTVLQANCVRCHDQAVANINHERACWECHRRIMHTRSGLMQTM